MATPLSYARTLKPKAVETPLDLLFFRPAAHVFVRLALPTPLSANGMTVLGIVVGVAGAALFAYPDRAHLVAAALLTLLYAILDCADGQLARARGTSSRMGRILDGMSDYVVGTVSGVAIAIHLGRASGGAGVALALAGLGSVIVQGTLFDHFKNRYLTCSAASYREGDDLEETLAALHGAKGFTVVLLSIYAVFLRVQRVAGGGRTRGPASPEQAAAYGARMVRVARGWAWLGPSTHVLLLAIFTCAGALASYVWLRLTVGNVVLLVLWIAQARGERELLDEADGVSSAP